MKRIYIFSVLSCAMLLCQCRTVVTTPAYLPIRTMETSGVSTSTSTVQWVDAMYDATGFPIYGFADGRPVYAYTVSGAPIYSVDAIVSSCYVPLWGPAAHYNGNWKYPHNVNRRKNPPNR